MATNNYTQTDAAFGFFGYFDQLTNSANRCWQDTKANWIGYMTGSSATMNCSADSTNPYWVSIDGGAATNPAISSGHITLFTGLSDVAHLVQIYADPGYSPTYNRTPTSGTLFAVTGASPAIGYGSDLGPSLNVALAASQCIDARAYVAFATLFAGDTNVRPNEHVANPGVTYYGAGGSTLVNATCTDLWIFTSATSAWYAVDKGVMTKVTLASNPSVGWKKVATGLDGNAAHDYTVVGTEAITDQGTMGVMVGGTGAAFHTPTARSRVAMFGDSITYGTGASTSATDIYKVAAALGFVGQGCGKEGQTTAGLASDIASIIATINSLDYAILAIGMNDTNGSQFRTDYTSCVNNLLSAGVPKVICRSIVPTPGDHTAVSADIATVVSTLANPDVTFLDASGWTTIDTLDNVHPTEQGYKDMAAYEITGLTPYFPQSTQAPRSIHQFSQRRH